MNWSGAMVVASLLVLMCQIWPLGALILAGFVALWMVD